MDQRGTDGWTFCPNEQLYGKNPFLRYSDGVPLIRVFKLFSKCYVEKKEGDDDLDFFESDYTW